MQGNQLRKNAAGAFIHNNINSYPILNIPMIINKKDGIIYGVLNAVFHNNDAMGMITTDGFTTTRVNTPIVLIKTMMVK